MSTQINNIENEENQVKELLEDSSIIINHNYFRAEKGVQPILHRILSFSMIYLGNIMKFYYLTFTSDHLILFNIDGLNDKIEDHIFRIKYADIENFAVNKIFIDYCIQFKYDSKQYYFYIDADGGYNITDLTASQRNFQSLKEKDFMGLLKK